MSGVLSSMVFGTLLSIDEGATIKMERRLYNEVLDIPGVACY